MDNNDFNNIPKPKYVNEYRSLKDILKAKRIGEKTYIDKVILQTFISLIIVAAVLVLNSNSTKFTNYIIDGIRNTINWQFDFAESFKNIGDITNIVPRSKLSIGSLSPTLNIADEGVIMPVDGEITSQFGERVHPVFKTVKEHNGIDISAEYGTDIKAAISGIVAEASDDETLGKYVVITNDNFKTIYAHCSRLLVEKGKRIKQGEIIAKVGDTGLTAGVHLHFEIWKDGKAIDPLEEIKTNIKTEN